MLATKAAGWRMITTTRAPKRVAIQSAEKIASGSFRITRAPRWRIVSK